MKVEYEIDKDIIYHNPGGVGISFYFVDKNTLQFRQCLFKKKGS